MATAPLPVHGADVSHHQGRLDLAFAKQSGLQFLYHKATEGDSFVDPDYAVRREQAKAAGLPFGAYHFARAEYLDGRPDARTEARRFIRVAAPLPGDLAPVLDLETTEGLTQDELRRWARVFCEEVERLVGVPPVLYGPWDFGLDLVRWVPRYNNTNIPPRVKWDIWQFSNGVLGVPNSFPGLGRVDLNTLRPDFRLSSIRIPHLADVEVVHYNVGDTSDRVLRMELIALTVSRPHAITLNEVGDRKSVIANVPGYQTITQSGQPSSSKIAILLRDDLPVKQVVLRQISERTPVERIVAGARKDGHAEPKYILSLLTEIDGVRLRFGTTHLVPSTTKLLARKARRLYRQQVAEVEQWITHGRYHRILSGDLNASPKTRWPSGHRPLAALAKVVQFLSAPTHGRREIDHILVPLVATQAEGQALEGFKSDHRPLRGKFRLRAK